MRSAMQHRDQLCSLALGEPADRLARRDAAVRENLVDLHATVLGDREQHVEDLRRLEEFGRVQEQLMDRVATRLEIAFELRALRANLVRTCQRIHSLVERTLRCSGTFMERLLTRRHGRRVYRLGGALQGFLAQFTSTSSRGRGAFSSLELFAYLCRSFAWHECPDTQIIAQ